MGVITASVTARIYRRHDNCDCTVTFENGSKRTFSCGKLRSFALQNVRQDVWSKREWEAPEPGAGAGDPVRLNKSQSAELYEKHKLKSLTSDEEHGKIKEKKYVPATQQEIQQFVADMQSLGFASVKGFEQFSERASLLKEITEDFGKLHDTFPEVFTVTHLSLGQLSEDVYAQYDPHTKIITLNTIFYNDLDYYQNDYKIMVNHKFHPPGTTYRATIPHEFGHAIEDYYNISNKRAAIELYNETHDGHFTRKLGDEWIISGLCFYASEGHYEDLIAESVAEMYDSITPRQISRLVFNYVLKKRG